MHSREGVAWTGGGGSAQPARPVPAELAFLISHGVPSSRLDHAARRAAEWNVSPEAAILGLGYIDETGYYRALATELGLIFLPEAIFVSEDAPYPDCIRAGIAPLAPEMLPLRFAVAPRGAALRHLLHRRGLLADIAITTPARLRTAVMRLNGPALADRAAGDLAAREPAMSFRGGISASQIALAVAAAGASAIAVAMWPSAFLDAAFVATGFVFLAAVVLRLAACFEPAPADASRLLLPILSERELPTYTIVVPLYREVRVVRRLVAALKALNYPPAKLDIKFLLEEDDRETLNALAALDLPARIEVIVAPPGMPRTKPRALNIALPLARGEYLVVYDAEDVPDPMQLRLAAATFAQASRDVACLQARLVIDNSADGPLALFFTLEYAALFDVLLPALARFILPIPLGGTSNHFRTAALRGLGGWDAWNVTEDADLGIRLARKGWRVADLPSPTFEEAPATFRVWLGQRTRWMKGWMQVCLTHSREPLRTWRELGAFGWFATVAMTFGTVVSALGFPFFTAASMVALYDGSLLRPQTVAEIAVATIALVLFVFGLAAMLLPALVGANRRGLRRLIPYAPLLPVYYLLVSLAAWRALYELVRAPSHWYKTEHGLARSSRSGALTDGAGVPLPRRPGGVSG